MPRYVLVTVLWCLAAACGSGERGITQPTSPRGVVFVHNTVNPPANRTSRGLQLSELRNRTPGILGFVDHQSYDDFTSAVTTTIRAVSWQGGYCGGAPLSGPVTPPVATSRSFQIAFFRDDNGSPYALGVSGGSALYEVTVTPADANERFAFDTGPTAGGCVREAPNASYYDYTAVLPTPFAVAAGVRYWLIVRADMRDTGGTWGWRTGTHDNNHSKLLGPLSTLITFPADLAFSLSDQ